MRSLKFSWSNGGTASVFACLLILVLCSGCGTTGKGSSPPPNPIGQSSDLPPGSTSPPPLLPPASSQSMVFDFPDVPVPQELSRIDGDSFVFQSGPLIVGLMTLRGTRVDVQSIINFYKIAMPRENWKPRGGFNAKKTVLIFEKPDKTCVINIYEKLFRTFVEVYVAPMSGAL